MSQGQALRNTMIQQADSFGTRRRFGLFSSPAPIAVGDDGQYKTKIHKRNEAGKPITQARGIFTNPNRSGQLQNKSYFQPINTLHNGEVKDQYIDPGRKQLQIANETFKKGYNKEQNFKPASGFKETASVPYEFKQENNPERDPKRNRDPDGKVKAAPRNFYTNQQSTVVRSYFKPIKHIDDPYQRAHQMQIDYAKKMKSLEHKQAKYKLNLNPKATFDTSRQTYCTKTQDFPEKKSKEPKFNIYPHENRWKSNNPNKSGLYGYLAPFPTYMENPPKELTRKPKQEGGKETFRRMSVANSTPSPSISLNRTNLSKTISHSVSHRR